MAMNNWLASAPAIALGFALAGCDNSAEKFAEEQADIMIDQAEALADQGMITEEQKDILREQADLRAEPPSAGDAAPDTPSPSADLGESGEPAPDPASPGAGDASAEPDASASAT